MSATIVKTEVVHKNVKFLQELNKVGCKVHGDAHLINDMKDGNMVCEECGVVVEERMICEDAEWRNFEGDSMAEKWSKSRTGDAENPFLSDDANLGTMVKSMDKSRNEGRNSFAGNIYKQFKRRSVDNALNHAFKEINDMADRINLPASVVLLAKELYTKLYKKIQLKGNIMLTDAKTAACLYVACKQDGCYRSTREISAIYAVKKRDLTNTIKRLLSVISLDEPTTAGTEMIDRFCSHLELSRAERKQAYKLAGKIDAIKGKKQWEPEAVAGVSIYVTTLCSQHGK